MPSIYSSCTSQSLSHFLDTSYDLKFQAIGIQIKSFLRSFIFI